MDLLEDRLDGDGVAVAVSHVDGGDMSTPLIVCIHGGGYTRRYFNISGASFLKRAEVNGFAAVAVDRPGYGDSDNLPVEEGWFPAQAAVLNAAIADAWRRFGGERPGIVLLGHSFGATVALRVAARHPSWPLLGVIVNGTLDETVPSMLDFAANLEGAPAHAPIALEPHMVRSFFYGPDGTFDPAVSAAAAVAVAPAPAVEIREWATGWPKDVAEVTATITAPVHIRVSEHDAVQNVSTASLARFVARLSSAPYVDSAMVRSSGHNSDHHYAGRAPHLEQLVFSRRCAIEWTKEPAPSA